VGFMSGAKVWYLSRSRGDADVFRIYEIVPLLLDYRFRCSKESQPELRAEGRSKFRSHSTLNVKSPGPGRNPQSDPPCFRVQLMCAVSPELRRRF
jgi:hypothetical protein